LTQNRGDTFRLAISPAIFLFLFPHSLPKGSCRLFLPIFLAEALNAASRIDQFLFAGKIGMALRANFRSDFLWMCGTGGKGVATVASDRHFLILGMNTFFHVFASFAQTWF
jgi:hypothetical protein